MTEPMRQEHPCTGCESTAYQGVVACPSAGAIVNKGRCRRVKRMEPAAAQLNLYRAWQARWALAKETEDIAVTRFLGWLLQGINPERFRAELGAMPPASQIMAVARPNKGKPVRARATGGPGSVAPSGAMEAGEPTASEGGSADPSRTVPTGHPPPSKE